MPRSVSQVRPRRANAIVMLISSTKNDLTGGSDLGSSAGGGRNQLFEQSYISVERTKDSVIHITLIDHSLCFRVLFPGGDAGN